VARRPGGEPEAVVMANEIETEQGDAVRPLVKCNFFEGKLMTHVAFQLEQEYHNRKHALSSRAVAGSGALCGLITGDYTFEAWAWFPKTAA
jgi:hypothetical protein